MTRKANNLVAILVFLISAPCLFAQDTGENEDISPNDAEEPKKESSTDMNSFDVVVKMNIFDPERGTPAPRPRPPVEAPPPRPERIALKGTLVEKEKAHAFLDGTNSEFRKVAELNAQVAEFTVKEIASTHVVLVQGEKEFKVMVGDELEKPFEGEWAIISTGGQGGFSSGASMGRASASGSSRGSSSSPPLDEGAMSDVMKRLLERRKQQMGQ